jgi:hypothetical protein
MKSGMKEQAEVKLHKVKGKCRVTRWNVRNLPN